MFPNNTNNNNNIITKEQKRELEFLMIIKYHINLLAASTTHLY